MAEARPLVDLDPKPIPTPPRPSIKSLNPGQLYGAGTGLVQVLTIEVDTCLPDVVALVDGAATTAIEGVFASDAGVTTGGIKVGVDMSALAPGIHLVTVSDGNGPSWGGVQVQAY